MKSAGGDWLRIATELQPETVALRRAIHREPEIGLSNPLTTAKVKAALAGLPLELREGSSTTGLVAVLRGAKPGRTVLLRGDMDALPMPEDVDVPFRSTIPGVMHACGHDSHTAMLSSAAKALCARRDLLAGTVLFMFQPGEEGWHGARYMMEDGLLDPTPDAAFALHIMPNGPAGVFASRPGTLMASSDTVRITVVGRGGHASMPHDAVDPVPIACEIVMALQALVTRRINAHDPAVLTFGKIEAGSTSNVIPETAHLLGTVRAVSETTRSDMHAGIQRVAAHIALAHGAHAEIEIEKGFPVTVCDGAAVRHAHTVLQDTFGFDAWRTMPSPVMGAEDFSYVLQKVKGAMIFLGVCPDGQDWRTACPCHSNRMELNEDVMARGVAAHCAIAERFLAEGFVS
ncbi:MAG: amidohydrolase [Alphaproteobacteria bacterium]|nr:amidohydrolase [Alphaproteobacteria bacterium]